MGVMANMTVTSKEGERTMVIDGGNVEVRYLFDTKSFNWAEQRVIM